MQLSLPRLAALLSIVPVFAAGVFYVGMHTGIDSVRVKPTGAVSLWSQDIALQQQDVTAAITYSQNSLNAFAARLGKLQARVDHADALGTQIVAQAGLRDDEFSFVKPKELVADSVLPDAALEASLMKRLRGLETRLINRQPKLEALSEALRNRDLAVRVRPITRPVRGGWKTSGFGYRTDPMTSARVLHKGTDFAAAHGTEILAAGDGVVIDSSTRNGYGNIVQVSHADGYVTRYAHNSKNLVKVGQLVRAGEPVALMGATGRTTGTHLHFEVHKDGKAVNPEGLLSLSK